MIVNKLLYRISFEQDQKLNYGIWLQDKCIQ